MDIFFGVDYHSHLGTKSGGMIVYDAQDGERKEQITVDINGKI